MSGMMRACFEAVDVRRIHRYLDLIFFSMNVFGVYNYMIGFGR